MGEPDDWERKWSEWAAEIPEGSKCAQFLDFQRTRVRNVTAAPGS